MKHLFLTLTLLAFGLGAHAQQNVVKLGLGSALQSDIHLKYERTFAEKHSIQLGILADTRETFNVTRPFPFGPDTADPALDSKLGGFAIIPEYRYYFSGAGAPRGFYAGVYLRYRQRNLSFDTNFNTDIDLIAKGRLRNVGAGIGCGAQFLISDKFVIDWYIGGLGYNQFYLSASVEPVNEEDFDQLKMDLIQEVNDFEVPSDQTGEDFITQEELDDVKDVLLTAIEATESRRFNSGAIPFGLLDIRTGLSVGYAF